MMLGLEYLRDFVAQVVLASREYSIVAGQCSNDFENVLSEGEV